MSAIGSYTDATLPLTGAEPLVGLAPGGGEGSTRTITSGDVAAINNDAIAAAAAAGPAAAAALPTQYAETMRFIGGVYVTSCDVNGTTPGGLTFGNVMTAAGDLLGVSNLGVSGVGVSNGVSVSDGEISLGTVENETPLGSTGGTSINTQFMRFRHGALISASDRDANLLSRTWTTANGAGGFAGVQGADSGTGYVYTIAADGNVYETPATTGISTRITRIFPNDDLTISGGIVQYQRDGVVYWQTIPTDGKEHRLIPSLNLYQTGDSLSTYTVHGFGQQLALLYQGRKTINQAQNTAKSEHIAFRTGATLLNGSSSPVTYTVVGGTIPAATTPFTITATGVDLFFSWNTTQGSFFGLVDGVPCLIAYDTGTTTATRLTAGSPITVGAPVTIRVTSGWCTNTLGIGCPSYPGLQEMTSWIMEGYNDLRSYYISHESGFVYTEAATMANMVQTAAQFTARTPRLIFGLLPQSALVLTPAQCIDIDASISGGAGFTGVPSGTATLGQATSDADTIAFCNAAASLRAAITAQFPFVVDFMQLFKNAGHTVSWGATQGLGQNYDFIRPDFNSNGTDGTHWTTLPAQALAASGVQAIINANGW